MNKNNDQHRNWLDMLALSISFFGLIVSVIGALSTLSYATQVASVWPLPGFVLLNWAIFGLIGFLMALICFIQISTKRLQAEWLIIGTLIPLTFVGAPTIGLFVLIAFLLFLISAIILSIRNRAKWLSSFGLLILGAICNLGILYFIITLGNRSY